MVRFSRLAGIVTLILGGCDRREEPEALRPTNLAEERVEPLADFSGSYASNWGPVECNQTGHRVKCVYTASGAWMDCEARGSKLDCRWIERTARGRGKFQRIATGSLVGTWGYAQSSDNRGAWMLTKRTQ
jgi:hypothetical protein